MAYGVRLHTMNFEDFQFTLNLASGITIDDVGKAVMIDTSAANTVKLATDGGVIFGRLETFEDRTQEGIKVGTISTKFAAQLKIATGATVNVGDRLIGGGSGTVKSTTAGAAGPLLYAMEIIGSAPNDYVVALCA